MASVSGKFRNSNTSFPFGSISATEPWMLSMCSDTQFARTWGSFDLEAATSTLLAHHSGVPESAPLHRWHHVFESAVSGGPRGRFGRRLWQYRTARASAEPPGISGTCHWKGAFRRPHLSLSSVSSISTSRKTGRRISELRLSVPLPAARQPGRQKRQFDPD